MILKTALIRPASTPVARRRPAHASLAALALATGLGATATASAMVLDGFDTPAAPTTRVVTGPFGSPTATVTINEAGLPGIPGGARDTTLNMYGNPLGSISALGLGAGRLSIAQGTGAVAESVIAYGAFTRVGGNPTVGGPSLRLDLSAFQRFVIDFAGAEDVLNINIEYYTSAPLNPAAPLYYSSAGINIGPTTSGAALSVTLPCGNNPAFNWKQVDGIRVIINRSGPTPATSYTLDAIHLEPALPALLQGPPRS